MVSDGAAQEIKEAVAANEEPSGEPAGVPNDADTLSAIENAIKSIMIKYSEEQDAKLESFKTELANENTELKNKIVELEKTPTSKPIRSSAEPKKHKTLVEFLNNKL